MSHAASHARSRVTTRRARLLALALLLPLAPSACGSEAPVATVGPGDEAGSTYVLRRVDGRPLPARTFEGAEGWQAIVADTLRFLAGGRVAVSGALHDVVTTRGAERDTVFTPRHELEYARTGDRVVVGSLGPCEDVIIVMGMCAANDTGSFRGDSLFLAVEGPRPLRRAYLRVAP